MNETTFSHFTSGIGSFTVVDGTKVFGSDLGSNFFVTKSHLGQSKAKTCCDLLQELNPDVQGHFVEEVNFTNEFDQ